VTKGNFKIDASLQIQAKPSMMSDEPPQTTEQQPGGEESVHKTAEAPAAFREQLWGIVEKYLSLHRALASDNKDGAATAAQAAIASLSSVDMSLLGAEQHELWMKRSDAINKALSGIKTAGRIEAARQEFELLSSELIAVVKQFGIPENRSLHRIHCPMAFNNKGADWLQSNADTLNPYFGASMPKCGQVTEVIGGKAK